ncbi:SAM-dependent DNA methyltransferase [Azohydromonas aeria]|uniref:SAM-dependent DNA methyltransferase n=1 Tax=Azohydromonas aeria TaxID=2590212 RepID=UPI0012FC4B71|nr:SAM-dependent DNA methyltransferase [Azohydromonas aeria]
MSDNQNQGVTLANAGSKPRRELDYYPTPPDATHALMQFLALPRNAAVWEPACGAGAMSDVLTQYVDSVYSTDIRQTGYGIGGKDFLATEYDCDAVITNPPFVLSEQFIRHARDQAPVVAMLLKSQYWHAARRASLFAEMPPAWVLPLTWRPDFLFDQRASGARAAPTMDVVWTVWREGQTATQYRPLLRPGRIPLAA